MVEQSEPGTAVPRVLVNVSSRDVYYYPGLDVAAIYQRRETGFAPQAFNLLGFVENPGFDGTLAGYQFARNTPVELRSGR